jgi:hypothetical protein
MQLYSPPGFLNPLHRVQWLLRLPGDPAELRHGEDEARPMSHAL